MQNGHDMSNGCRGWLSSGEGEETLFTTDGIRDPHFGRDSPISLNRATQFNRWTTHSADASTSNRSYDYRYALARQRQFVTGQHLLGLRRMARQPKSVVKKRTLDDKGIRNEAAAFTRRIEKHDRKVAKWRNDTNTPIGGASAYCRAGSELRFSEDRRSLKWAAWKN